MIDGLVAYKNYLLKSVKTTSFFLPTHTDNKITSVFIKKQKNNIKASRTPFAYRNYTTTEPQWPALLFFFYSNLLCATVDCSTAPTTVSESNNMNESGACTSKYTLIVALSPS